MFALCAELAKLGKASQDPYNPGGRLILKVLLKNGIAEGVTFDPHDTILGVGVCRYVLMSVGFYSSNKQFNLSCFLQS